MGIHNQPSSGQAQTVEPPTEVSMVTWRSKSSFVLNVTESGALNLIMPCHEYKAFTNTDKATKEEKIKKFPGEVIRFTAACMNSCTNGTILFGVGDEPDFCHGQILGVSVQDEGSFVKSLPLPIEKHFEHKHKEAAKKCIKTPWFIEVLNPNMTLSEEYEATIYTQKGPLHDRWNFHFSEQPGKMPFIKWDKFNYIKDIIILDLLSLKRPCVFLNLLHEPGCGGTTLAKHMLWELRDKFRCAVLKDTTAVPTEVAQQVVELLTFKLAARERTYCKEKLEKIKTTYKNAWKTFYGFRILMENFSEEYVEAFKGKIKAVTEMPVPKDIADIQHFMVNYVSKFSPNIAELTKPTRDLLKAENDWICKNLVTADALSRAQPPGEPTEDDITWGP
ncbi:sterile alpha motif domain-containing protein 9-like [Salmo trutta]|uniref:sterile alpha motif domain-containing protein 9-like n=1 Tax=Salmo trutta TaxID=8032 RepID=UPI00113041DB|nr:sterile alpha motif domain-containing protein 9-like [Salmo trutta]